ncbi:MAG: hypothetical protein ACXAD7_18550, partial [Candidatus Kariarchaeaceae archaeon]
MEKSKLPFIVLAGSPETRDILMEYANVEYKALIDINGQSMITRVLDAINKSNIASRIFITGLPKELVVFPDNMDQT